MGSAESGGMGGAASGAASGALIGSVVPGIGTAFGAVAGGLLGGLGGMSSGKGADKAAKAAQRAAQERMAYAKQNYNTVNDILGKASVESLSQYDRALQFQEKNVARQEQMIAQIDPTIIEASQQALKLLRGEESSTLTPIKNQRNLQRQKLLNQLREQLGPGAETSTAGIQALTRFDSETNNLMAGQQQSALQGLGNTFGQFSAYRPNMSNDAITFGNLATGRYGIESNRAGMLNQAMGQVVNHAGANEVAAVAQGQYQQAMGNQVVGSLTQLGAGALTGMLGNATKAKT